MTIYAQADRDRVCIPKDEDKDPIYIITEKPIITLVEVQVPGPQGPRGLPAGTFVYNQPVPSSSWRIQHDMSKYPSVTIVDSSHRTVVGSVEYEDDMILTVKFENMFSGKAYLN